MHVAIICSPQVGYRFATNTHLGDYVIRIDMQVLLEWPIDLLVVLILCADICLSILEYHTYVMSDIARCDEIISSMLRCVIMMRLCV